MSIMPYNGSPNDQEGLASERNSPKPQARVTPITRAQDHETMNDSLTR
jgi:hypothetical protein